MTDLCFLCGLHVNTLVYALLAIGQDTNHGKLTWKNSFMLCSLVCKKEGHS